MAAVELSAENPVIIPLIVNQRKRGRTIHIGQSRQQIVREAYHDHCLWLDSKNIEYCFHIKNESNTVIFDFGRECDAVLFKMKWG